VIDQLSDDLLEGDAVQGVICLRVRHDLWG
jgi:hypothetical protein